MSKRIFNLINEQVRRRAQEAIWEAPDGYRVTLCEQTRSLDQNAAQWPYLEGFAKQKQLCINGAMQWVTNDDWKDVLTACWNGEMRMALFDGKVIMMPQRTSNMGKKVFSEWMEFLVAMAAQSEVTPIYKTGPKHDQS
ncbi:MAG: recombination protein NinB [Rhodoferax sp.]|uniref:recombination protein NinB n=1 Tax=Rhodoferax sp. TaxID=50421 RepID=UPI003019A584